MKQFMSVALGFSLGLTIVSCVTGIRPWVALVFIAVASAVHFCDVMGKIK